MTMTIKHKITASIAATFTALQLTGCATLVNGSHQEVSFKSDPPGAKVTVDGKVRGETPMEVSLDRGNDHKARITYPNYQPKVIHITTDNQGGVTTGEAIGYLILGGVVLGGPALAVDIASGGLSNLSPNDIKVTLVPRQHSGIEQGRIAGAMVNPEATKGALTPADIDVLSEANNRSASKRGRVVGDPDKSETDKNG